MSPPPADPGARFGVRDPATDGRPVIGSRVPTAPSGYCSQVIHDALAEVSR